MKRAWLLLLHPVQVSMPFIVSEAVVSMPSHKRNAL